MSGNPGGRAGRLSHGALSSHALMDSGVKEAGSAVGGWGAGHLPMCVHVRIALGEPGSYLLEHALLRCACLHLPITAGTAI